MLSFSVRKSSYQIFIACLAFLRSSRKPGEQKMTDKKRKISRKLTPLSKAVGNPERTLYFFDLQSDAIELRSRW